ncbi:MAG TPA: hypothetical protein VG498_08615 [Terriglobales bacterium]|nr:hypothetical protein [Terriglobales bacterium]
MVGEYGLSQIQSSYLGYLQILYELRWDALEADCGSRPRRPLLVERREYVLLRNRRKHFRTFHHARHARQHPSGKSESIFSLKDIQISGGWMQLALAPDDSPMIHVYSGRSRYLPSSAMGEDGQTNYGRSPGKGGECKRIRFSLLSMEKFQEPISSRIDD